jgi:hypothetical protein
MTAEPPASDLEDQVCRDEAPDRSGAGSVTLLELHCDSRSRSEVRKLEVRIGEARKTIWHYLFTRWPDYTKPEGEDRTALLELMEQSFAKAGGSLNPRFVHCSAGVGRTGTFIALDHLIRELGHDLLKVPQSPQRPASSGQLASGSRGPSRPWSRAGSFLMTKDSNPEATEDLIFETVNALREQRMMMVMNEVQYGFIYETISEVYLDSHLDQPTTGAISTRREGPEAGDIEAGHRPSDSDSGEGPSPKLARTRQMSFIGPAGASQENMKNVAVAVHGVPVTRGNTAPEDLMQPTIDATWMTDDTR